MQKSTPSIVVLISGRGSNLSALIAHAERTGHYSIGAVISNKSTAAGLLLAAQAGIPTRVLDHKQFDSREAFDQALLLEIEAFSPSFVVLAGFMRILTPQFVEAFYGRLINIHPSLLPAFTGLNTHERAIDAGVRVHGVTVHFVTAELDHGPIVDQAIVQIEAADTAETLSQRVLALEHEIYPRALAGLAKGELKLVNDRVEGALSTSLITSSFN
jgi:phosphoribosylglycinamide formyltransferase-1